MFNAVHFVSDDMQHNHIPKNIKFTKYTLGDWAKAFKLKPPLICFINIAALPACKISAKILTTALVISKFKYLTFDPKGGVKGGGVKFGHCHS